MLAVFPRAGTQLSVFGNCCGKMRSLRRLDGAAGGPACVSRKREAYGSRVFLLEESAME